MARPLAKAKMTRTDGGNLRSKTQYQHRQYSAFLCRSSSREERDVFSPPLDPANLNKQMENDQAAFPFSADEGQKELNQSDMRFWFVFFVPAQRQRLPWNHKRVYRIYRELELNLRIKPRKRVNRENPEALAVPERPNWVC